jgi:hypothetical protein
MPTLRRIHRTLAGATLVAGVILGGFATAALVHGAGAAEALAQAEAKPSAPGRYQISSFYFGYGYSGEGRMVSESKWGAYILDTQTGDLSLSVEGGKPAPVGRVGEK